MSELQLTKSGIKRLESMRKEAVAGDFDTEVTCRRDDGTPLYFFVKLPSGNHCAFVSKESEITEYLVKSIDATFSGPIKMHLFDPVEIGRYATTDRPDGLGIALNRSDYSTPAQRSLESLRSRLEAI